MTRLGSILQHARGNESRLSFTKRLGLSYTFVRAMELGERHPSDDVLTSIAQRLGLDVSKLMLATYCDRSPALAQALEARGVLGDLPQPLPIERAS